MRNIHRIALGILTTVATLNSQWLYYRAKGIPRLSDGRPDMKAPAPFGPQNIPDLSGVWQAEPDPKGGVGGVENSVPPRFFASIAGGLNPGKLPMQP